MRLPFGGLLLRRLPLLFVRSPPRSLPPDVVFFLRKGWYLGERAVWPFGAPLCVPQMSKLFPLETWAQHFFFFRSSFTRFPFPFLFFSQRDLAALAWFSPNYFAPSRSFWGFFILMKLAGRPAPRLFYFPNFDGREGNSAFSVHPYPRSFRVIAAPVFSNSLSFYLSRFFVVFPHLAEPLDGDPRLTVVGPWNVAGCFGPLSPRQSTGVLVFYGFCALLTPENTPCCSPSPPPFLCLGCRS